MERPLSVVRGGLGKQAVLALGSMVFITIGGMMLALPPPEHSLWGWSNSVGRVAQGVIGFVALLLGGVALALLILLASRPILLLYPDHLVDSRRKLSIPFTEIRQFTIVNTRGIVSMQWMLLQMRDPLKYARFERLSKQSGLSDADLTLDLSLASESDFEKARSFIADRIKS